MQLTGAEIVIECLKEQGATPLLGKDSFQEIDIAGITMPITKHNFFVKDVRNLADTIRQAFRIARSGRPGPVLIDIPKDVTANLASYHKIKSASYVPDTPQIDEQELERAIVMIEQAQSPYIFVGGGAALSGASEELIKFVDLVDAPVADSLMGKGSFPGTDFRYTGMLGMHGTKTSNLGVSECDLLIVLGSRFSDRVTGNVKKFTCNAKLLQIDIDSEEINKNVVVDSSITGDLNEVLKVLNHRLSQQSHPQWMAHIQEYNKKYPLKYAPEVLCVPYIVEEIYRQTRGDVLITTEVGQHQMWSAQYYRYTKPRTFITSGGLGTMGFGLGASLGAKIGCAFSSDAALPVSERREDIEAARRAYFEIPESGNWAWNVSWWSDPIVFGHYPEDGLRLFAKDLPEITEENMRIIHQPPDFYGQNIYRGIHVAARGDGYEKILDPPGTPKTAIGWPVHFNCLYWGAKFLYERYQIPVFITENGMSGTDWPSMDGKIHDVSRIDYLHRHIRWLERAAMEGIDVGGYFTWSLLDNFEWTSGYSNRFGIIYVDYATQKRIPKDSYYWYQKVIKIML